MCPQGLNTPDTRRNRDGPEPEEECPQPDEEGEEVKQFAQFERRMLNMMNDALRNRGAGSPRALPSDYPREMPNGRRRDGEPVGNRYGPMFRHQEPPVYDGEKQTWDDFFQKFEAVSDWNGWNDRERADSLHIHVSGEAERFLNDIPDSRWKTYQELQQAMQKEFGAAKQLRQNKALIASITKKENETYADLSKRLRQLARRIHPQNPNQATELAKEAFVRALPDPDIQLAVLTKDPEQLLPAPRQCSLASSRRRGATRSRRTRRPQP